MAKMRVYELAKELNIKTTDVFEALRGTSFEVSNVSSNLSDEAQQIVRKAYQKTPQEPERAHQKTGMKKAGAKTESGSRIMTFSGARREAPAPPRGASAEHGASSAAAGIGSAEQNNAAGDGRRPQNAAGGQRPAQEAGTPRKKNISSVFNAQYSNTASSASRRPAKTGGQSSGRGSTANTAGGSRQPNKSRPEGPRPQTHTIIRPRPIGERSMRPIGERTAKREEEEAKSAAAAANEAKTEEEMTQNPALETQALSASSIASASQPQPILEQEGQKIKPTPADGQTEEKRPDAAIEMQPAPAAEPADQKLPAAKEQPPVEERPDMAAAEPKETAKETAAAEAAAKERPAEEADKPAGQGRILGNVYAGQNQRTAAEKKPAASATTQRRDPSRRGENAPRQQGQRSADGERKSGMYRNDTRTAPSSDRRGTDNRRNGASAGGTGTGRPARSGASRPGAPRPGERLTEGAERSKSGADRNDRRAANRGHGERADYDKLGTKKQENFVNLERHGGKKKTVHAPQSSKPDEDEIKSITIPEKISIRELADLMKVQASALIKKLFLQGEMVTVNSELTFDEAEEIAADYNIICEPEEQVDVIAEMMKEEEDREEDLLPRPPVVCVMGHVDHGKTSLLDAIRSTRVTEGEAGGITQAIGASVVTINGQKITFLDTPGHEAFTAMRMRGANSTDIAVLVIAADDGVMPQTIEAIHHAQAAGVEIMVAINKIDKVGANPEKVKQQLTEYGLVPEDWGGSTVFCEVSARTGEGIDNLLEMILLTAEVLELRANPRRNARGLVIEARLDKGRGAVATMLVQNGTLHVGDTIVCGSCYGRVRAMFDDQGQRIKEAGPSMPAEILGLSGVPNAGEVFKATDSEKEAKEIADAYVAEEKKRLLEDTKTKMSVDELFSQIKTDGKKELRLLVKADVQGSVEAVKQSLLKLSDDEVTVSIIHDGVGAVNESDVILASASDAMIIGFNVRPDAQAKSTAESEGVQIRFYDVIYNLIGDIEAAMKGMLDPIYEERVIGHAQIRQIFKASGVGNIAGSYVTDGVIERGCKIRIYRGGEQIYEGALSSLRRFQDDVREVRSNYECGLVFENFNDIAEEDTVEAYKMVEVPRV